MVVQTLLVSEMSGARSTVKLAGPGEVVVMRHRERLPPLRLCPKLVLERKYAMEGRGMKIEAMRWCIRVNAALVFFFVNCNYEKQYQDEGGHPTR